MGLLSENNYFSTILPRIPKKIQDSINVKVKRPRAALVGLRYHGF